MAVDHKLVADLESAVAAVQAEVDQCHAAREAYIRAHEVKPPGIGQWRGVVPIDCSIPEQELDRNKRELEDARKGEPSTLPRQGQPSGPPTESAPERSNPTDEAAQQVSKAVDDEKTLAAKRAVQMSDTQVSMDLTAGGLLATGIALNVGGMIPATTGVGLIVTAVAETTGVILDISAVAVFALGSGCQSLGNRFQQIADHPPRQDFQVPLRFNPYPQLPKPQGVTDAILRGFGTQLVLMAVGLGRLVTAVERYEGASQARRHFEGLRVPQMVRYMADRELQQAETSAHIAAACADLADSLLRHEREVQSEWQALRELIQMQGSLEARDPGKELREQLRASWHKYRNEMGQVLDLDTSEQNELDGIVDGMISRLRPQSELPEKLVDGKLADVLRPTALELEQISARFQQLTDSLRTDLGYAPSSKKVVDDLTMRGVPLEPDNAKSDFDAAIRLRTAYWIPERASTGWWGASTETGPAMPDMLVRLGDALLLPPGEYRVYWRQDAQHRPVPLAKGVRVDPGRLLEIDASSGLRLKLARGLPQMDMSSGWWGVVRAGEWPDPPLYRSGSAEPLLLPPGDYDVYWTHDYHHDPVLLSQSVNVSPDHLTNVDVDSGIQLRIAEWVGRLDPNTGWWGAVRHGNSPSKRVNWSAAGNTILLPPGIHDLYWCQDYLHKPMLVTMVDVHGLTNVDLDSGIRLRIADWVSPLDPSNGWWGAIRHGDSAAQRVNWSVSGTALPLAPATYDVYWCQDYRHEPMLIADAVDVRPGGPVQVSADSGLQLKLPERIAKPDSTGQWGVVPSGSELKQPINWWAGGIDAPLLVPPGRYDVLWQQDYAHPMERIIEGIEVPAGTLVQAAVPS